MFCARCGAEIRKGENFCNQCGNPVAGNPAAENPVPKNTETGNPVVPENQNQNNKIRISKGD